MLTMFFGGLGVGMGIVSLTWLVWWAATVPTADTTAPGLYQVPGPPDPATVSDDKDFDQATESAWCAAHMRWETRLCRHGLPPASL